MKGEENYKKLECSCNWYSIQARGVVFTHIASTTHGKGENIMAGNENYRSEMKDARRETTWTIWHWLPVLVLIIIISMAIGWFTQGNEFFMYKFFAPKQEQVRHDTFKNSQAYVDGKVEELQQYMLEYKKAAPEHKAALKTVIIRESVKVDEKYLPSDLNSFISRLKSE
ncbi:MAG: hypothetical protein ACD_56C00146G0020 [uncultured bacterium]|nr:MAG: hypothetical protein ACD_56C00146G0020 [uncultured bacterium]